MIVSEDEAKTKWCPHTRVGFYAGHGGVAVNRHPEGEDTLCIGSGCMAWRFHAWVEYVQLDKSDPVHFETKVHRSTTRGYCGLAGDVKGVTEER